MSELRIGTATSEPAAGTLKVGSSDVQEIYLGSTKVWPTAAPLPPGEVQIGNLIWTDVNTSTLDMSGGQIAIVSNFTEAKAAYNSGAPAAAYWRFDPANSVRGLYYNKHAAGLITRPSGFRLPTEADYDNLLSETQYSGSNIYTSVGGGTTNFWNSTIQNDFRFGTSGFNAIKAGWMYLTTRSSAWIGFDSTWWDSTRLSQERTLAFREQPTHISPVLQSNTKKYITIRFCKDA
jgi:uncharacterized protein (TIGR02145 family)